MHFTTLGYARPDGQTSDHWLPGGVARLEWEPEFYKYVRDAFAPVGLMIDFWKETAVPGTNQKLSVRLINDLSTPWAGPVTLSLQSGSKVLFKKQIEAQLAALGSTDLRFDLTWPEQTGPCLLEAELRGADDEPVHSVRAVTLNPPPVK